MQFTLIFRGRVPAGGEVSELTAMRSDPYLQAQFQSLRLALGATTPGLTQLCIGGILYQSMLPLTWVSKVDIQFIRANPPTGIRGLPDLDNAAKALLDGLCPPYGEGVLPPPADTPKLFCLALDDKQFAEITLRQTHHWGSKTENDNLAIITVETKSDPISEITRFGSNNLSKIRNNAFAPK